MRAWLDILRERHPGVEWVAVEREEPEEPETSGDRDTVPPPP
jgi:hypothetical protein